MFCIFGKHRKNYFFNFNLVSGTDKLAVDRESGEVRLLAPLDRETNATLRFFVTLEDEVPGGQNNLVRVPMSIIVLDDNDNPPAFQDVRHLVTRH